MWTRAGLKANALAIFKANYWKTVLIAFIFAIVGGVGISSYSYSSSSTTNNELLSEYDYSISHMTEEEMGVLLGIVGVVLVILAIVCLVSIAISVFVFNPLIVGCDRYFVVNHYQPADIGEVGFGFKTNYMNVVKTMFLTKLFIALWSLLLVVPGIIKSYAYMMVPYILADNPDMDSKEARQLSEQMMNGHKWDTFVLSLSFIGWFLLRAIPVVGFFVGIFWVNPYYSQTLSELYISLRDGGMTVPYCGVDNSINNIFNGQNNVNQNMNNTFNGQQMNNTYNAQQGYQQPQQNQNMNANNTPYYGQQGYQQPQQNQNMNVNNTPYYGQQGYQQPQQNQNMNANNTPYYGQQSYQQPQQNQNMNVNNTTFYGQQQTTVNTDTTINTDTTSNTDSPIIIETTDSSVNVDATVNTDSTVNTETTANTESQGFKFNTENTQSGFDNSSAESSYDYETFKTDFSFNQNDTDDTNKTE